MNDAGMPKTGYPVAVSVVYPERLSRGLLILRTLFASIYVGVPHGICLIFYGIGAVLAEIIAWFAVLFTGRFPKDLFEFIVGYKRWEMRVRAYMLFLTDQYPPFTGKE